MLWLIKCQNNLPGDLEEPGDRKTLTTKPPRTDHIWLAESREASFHQGGFLGAGGRVGGRGRVAGLVVPGINCSMVGGPWLFKISSFPLKARRCSSPKVSGVMVEFFFFFPSDKMLQGL